MGVVNVLIMIMKNGNRLASIAEGMQKIITGGNSMTDKHDLISRQTANTKMKKYRKKPIVIEAYQTDRCDLWEAWIQRLERARKTGRR